MVPVKSRLVVISNRLPMSIVQGDAGPEIRPSSGGLVTALMPVLRERRALWIGWIGQEESEASHRLIAEANALTLFDVLSVPISQEEERSYYYGFANEGLWPLFHDLLGFCNFDPEQWHCYQRINRRFAETAHGSLSPQDTVWIHDYQLLLVGAELRRLGARNRLVFFLHIPFPPFALLRRFPWRRELVESLLQHDVVGFQTRQDLANFVTAVNRFTPGLILRHEDDRVVKFEFAGRGVKLGAFPISIDFDDFCEAASSPTVEAEAHNFAEMLGTRTLIMGLDRLDYTKGIPERFQSFEGLLERYPDLRGRVSLYQCVIPSRTQVPDYQNLKRLLDELVGRINGHFYRPGWLPIHYVYRSLNRTELLGRYRACDVALVTPLRDGMNLVSKEYCAARVKEDGVLVLSEFAGSAEELGEHAVMTNPYDQEGRVEALRRAVTMPAEERHARMVALRDHLRRHDVYHWVQSMLDA